MKTTYFTLLALSFLLMSCNHPQAFHRENGWYYMIDGENDSISKEPIITVKEFTALKLESDAFGKLVISGQISKHRLNKWANATEKSIGKRIGFVFNGTVITAPQVNSRLESGNFQISNPYGYDLNRIFRQIKQEKIDSIEKLFKGWNKDSMYHTFNKEELDSMIIATDYWDAYAWKDLVRDSGESMNDTAKYQELEKALFDELQKYNIGSCAQDYMKSDAYKKYKVYICNNPEHINLMFQSFLFSETKGLNGYLIDDIIQTKYPIVPSIKTFVDKTDNKDDEAFAICEYKKKIWIQMNEERTTQSCRGNNL